jgi:hypothetical protein
MRQHVVVSGSEVFRVNFSVGQNRHVVGVAVPSGDDVNVNVLIEAGAAGFAQIESDIESLGGFNGAQNFHAFLSQAVDFGEFFFFQLGDAGEVPVGGDHHMAGVVRENIHDDKTMGSPVEDEIFWVFFRAGKGAKDAISGFIFLDVFHSPGGPYLFHRRNSLLL